MTSLTDTLKSLSAKTAAKKQESKPVNDDVPRNNAEIADLFAAPANSEPKKKPRTLNEMKSANKTQKAEATAKVKTTQKSRTSKATGEEPTGKPTKVEKAPAKRKRTVKKAITLESREKEIIAKYKHVIAGTIEYDESKRKYSVEAKLKCGHVHRLYTSDLFQVTKCPKCKNATRSVDARLEKEEAKATPEKKRTVRRKK